MYSQIVLRKEQEFLCLSDSPVKAIFNAIGMSCQGNREVCAPGFLMADDAFYNVDCPQLPDNTETR